MSDVISLSKEKSKKDGSFDNDFGFATNCKFKVRDGESVTYINRYGSEVIGLNGYMVMPIECYVELRKKAHPTNYTNSLMSRLTFWDCGCSRPSAILTSRSRYRVMLKRR